MKEVVPWKCHICAGEFDTPGGGVCSRCNRATCRAHFYQLAKKLKFESMWVCEECLTLDEKKFKKKRWSLKLPDLFKRSRQKIAASWLQQRSRKS